jgi:hypothetical protein
MKKFEYKLLRPTDSSIEKLNELGAEGWNIRTMNSICTLLERELD